MSEARKRPRRFWAGLVVAGSMGWMIALPMVAGGFVGRFCDQKFGTDVAFTIGLLFTGLCIGSYTVWRTFLRELF